MLYEIDRQKFPTPPSHTFMSGLYFFQITGTVKTVRIILVGFANVRRGRTFRKLRRPRPLLVDTVPLVMSVVDLAVGALYYT